MDTQSSNPGDISKNDEPAPTTQRQIHRLSDASLESFSSLSPSEVVHSLLSPRPDSDEHATMSLSHDEQLKELLEIRGALRTALHTLVESRSAESEEFSVGHVNSYIDALDRAQTKTQQQLHLLRSDQPQTESALQDFINSQNAEMNEQKRKLREIITEPSELQSPPESPSPSEPETAPLTHDQQLQDLLETRQALLTHLQTLIQNESARLGEEKVDRVNSYIDPLERAQRETQGQLDILHSDHPQTELELQDFITRQIAEINQQNEELTEIITGSREQQDPPESSIHSEHSGDNSSQDSDERTNQLFLRARAEQTARFTQTGESYKPATVKVKGSRAPRREESAPETSREEVYAQYQQVLDTLDTHREVTLRQISSITPEEKSAIGEREANRLDALTGEIQRSQGSIILMKEHIQLIDQQNEEVVRDFIDRQVGEILGQHTTLQNIFELAGKPKPHLPQPIRLLQSSSISAMLGRIEKTDHTFLSTIEAIQLRGEVNVLSYLHQIVSTDSATSTRSPPRNMWQKIRSNLLPKTPSKIIKGSFDDWQPLMMPGSRLKFKTDKARDNLSGEFISTDHSNAYIQTEDSTHDKKNKFFARIHASTINLRRVNKRQNKRAPALDIFPGIHNMEKHRVRLVLNVTHNGQARNVILKQQTLNALRANAESLAALHSHVGPHVIPQRVAAAERARTRNALKPAELRALDRDLQTNRPEVIPQEVATARAELLKRRANARAEQIKRRVELLKRHEKASKQTPVEPSFVKVSGRRVDNPLLPSTGSTYSQRQWEKSPETPAESRNVQQASLDGDNPQASIPDLTIRDESGQPPEVARAARERRDRNLGIQQEREAEDLQRQQEQDTLDFQSELARFDKKQAKKGDTNSGDADSMTTRGEKKSLFRRKLGSAFGASFGSSIFETPQSPLPAPEPSLNIPDIPTSSKDRPFRSRPSRKAIGAIGARDPNVIMEEPEKEREEEQRPIDTPTVDKLSGTGVGPESAERPTGILPISTRPTKFTEADDTNVADNFEFWGTEENRAGYIEHNSNVAKPEEKQEAFWQRVKQWIDRGVPEAEVLTPMVDKAYTHVRESVTPPIPQDTTTRNSLRQEYLMNNGINPAKRKMLPADFVNSKKEMIIAAFTKRTSKSSQRSDSRSSISSDGSDKKGKKTQR